MLHRLNLLRYARFQSAPLTEVSGDSTESIRRIYQKVSIRAAHRSERRYREVRLLVGYTVFQSAPLTEVSGDPETPMRRCLSRLFQSAPLTEVSGDLNKLCNIFV